MYSEFIKFWGECKYIVTAHLLLFIQLGGKYYH